MNRHARSAWVLAGGLVLLVLGLVGQALPTKHTFPPLRVYYENAGGPVLFPHDRHTEMEAACADCHHELATGELENDCLLCHHENSFALTEWEDEDMADLHDTFVSDGDAGVCVDCHSHNDLIQPLRPVSQSTCVQCHEEDLVALQTGHNCSGCHATQAGDQVAACGQCHRTGEGEDASCASCHADDGYTADMLEHAELVAIEGHTCSSCHVASRGSDAIHHGCNRCHADLEEGTFFARSREDAETVCSTCHMK